MKDHETLESILAKTSGKINVLGVDTSLYQNSGANIIQQVAYALAHLNEYLNASLITKKATIQFTFSVGSTYFFEIAKLRAFRYLFKKLIAEYDLECELNILVEPTLRNKTLYDYNVNMLRTTTECMSAYLGGANAISNVAYDAIYHKSNEFGERIARNQLLILQEESYYKNAQEIATGSYYIEELTYEIANKSLKLFKDIEKNGGLLEQLKKGTIQRKIEESANKEQKQFDAAELILLGTNKYSNEQDKMKDDLELFPFVKTNIRKTEIKPIIPRRLAEKLEQERIKCE
jgi:methylmalonyl-CoA mutase